MQKNYSSEEAVLLDIKQLTQKRDYLRLLSTFTNYHNCKCYFTASNINNVSTTVFLSNDEIPYKLEDEIRMIIEDSIAHYNRDIASLSIHLKNL